MKPYVLMSPDFNPTSGGIRVMWALYGWLLAKGQIAYMNRRPDGKIIAIYPEIMHGNPAQADTVVRYILNEPGVMGSVVNGVYQSGPTSFDATDKIYVFSKVFNTLGVMDDHLLFLPVINLHLFKDQKKVRTKTCYLIGKGTNKRQHPEDSIELTRAFAQDQQALADLLNECHTLYCYDKLTAMMEVARLCGCKVKYFGDYAESDLAKYEPGVNGISYGDKDVKLNVEAFRDQYEELVRTFSEKLDQFIDETQT